MQMNLKHKSERIRDLLLACLFIDGLVCSVKGWVDQKLSLYQSEKLHNIVKCAGISAFIWIHHTFQPLCKVLAGLPYT